MTEAEALEGLYNLMRLQYLMQRNCYGLIVNRLGASKMHTGRVTAMRQTPQCSI